MNKPFAHLIQLVEQFRDDRDWKQFHNPKNLAESLVVEASELLEHFLWKDHQESEAYLKNPKAKAEVESEVADVMMNILLFCSHNNIDIEEVVKKKVEETGKRYPVETSKGKAMKYQMGRV